MRIFAFVLVMAIAMILVSAQHASLSASAEPSFLYTVAKRYEPLAWMEGGERFSSGANIFIRDANGRRALVPGFADSADPAVSFDGKNVLFAGRRTGQERWQIWEMSLEGKDPRRITNCAEDCVKPFYLPDERMVYAEKSKGRFVIQSMAIAGGQSLALTYDSGSSFPSDVLRDGRVLFEASFPLGAKGKPELYTVYTDGSGVESYRCDHGEARHAAKQVESGDIVFTTQHGLARFTSARAKQVPLSAPAGEYEGDVAETTLAGWLLAWRPGDRRTVRGAASRLGSEPQWLKPTSSPVSNGMAKAVPYPLPSETGPSQVRLMWWKPGEKTLRPAIEEQGSEVVQPVVVTERTAPKRHPSGLHDWPVANLLCLNAYTSKYKFADASIRSVRLYTRTASSGEQLLGTAPVEADGSFFVQVTGDQPLQIELLDGAGKTLKREAGWFWLRRGEQRACVGCHAGPETAPENAVPMVLLKSPTPADMIHSAGNVAIGGR